MKAGNARGVQQNVSMTQWRLREDLSTVEVSSRIVFSWMGAWHTGALVFDNLCGLSMGKQPLAPKMLSNDFFLGQSEGDGALVSSLPNVSLGM